MLQGLEKYSVQAHAFLVGELHSSNPDSFSLDGRQLNGGSDVGLLSRQDLAHSPSVLAVLESPALVSAAAKLLQVIKSQR